MFCLPSDWHTILAFFREEFENDSFAEVYSYNTYSDAYMNSMHLYFYAESIFPTSI